MSIRNIFGLVIAAIGTVLFAILCYLNAIQVINYFSVLGAIAELAESGELIWFIADFLINLIFTAFSIWGVIFGIIQIVKFCSKKLDDNASVQKVSKFALILGVPMFIISLVQIILIVLMAGPAIMDDILSVALALVGGVFWLVCGCVAKSAAKGNPVSAAKVTVAMCFGIISTIIGFFIQPITHTIIYVFFIIYAIATVVTAFLPAKKEAAAEEPKE